MTDDNNNEQNPFEQIFGMLFGANGPGSGQGDDKNSSGMPQGFPIDPAMMSTIMSQMQGLFGQGADPQARQCRSRRRLADSRSFGVRGR